MTAIDWGTHARLMERKDEGSDLYFEFAAIAEGQLGALIGEVMRREPGDRQRVVIDAGTIGMLNIGQIVDLAERADFPRD